MNEKDFWKRVNKNGPVIRTDLGQCWVWTGSICNKYGNFRFKGGWEYSHRFSWILHNGSIPNKMQICHKCDNTICVNPSHLFIGTAQNNANDMINKGRNKCCRGIGNYNHKLTEFQIIEIKSCIKYKGWGTDLARKFGVSSTLIYDIKNGKKWKHILD